MKPILANAFYAANVLLFIALIPLTGNGDTTPPVNNLVCVPAYVAETFTGLACPCDSFLCYNEDCSGRGPDESPVDGQCEDNQPFATYCVNREGTPTQLTCYATIMSCSSLPCDDASSIPCACYADRDTQSIPQIYMATDCTSNVPRIGPPRLYAYILYAVYR